MAQLEIYDLTQLYNGKKVLDIPYLAFKKGRIYGVMGPNGAGKTTLLSILGLLKRPTTGKIYFEGKDVKIQRSYLRKHLTLVLQNPLLFDTTVEKNVAYGLKIRNIPKKDRDERIQRSLNLVGLNGFQKRRARELSGGEIQRVAIAQALAIEPKILFLDEPTANVDRENVEILEEIIKELNRKYQITVILATHNLDQSYRIADEVISLFEGKIRGISPNPNASLVLS